MLSLFSLSLSLSRCVKFRFEVSNTQRWRRKMFDCSLFWVVGQEVDLGSRMFTFRLLFPAPPKLLQHLL
ncbi:hypothetical protein JHK86_034592 [Glycine max]|nr:hypothetical protein JHK86_034592 [Glycine max]